MSYVYCKVSFVTANDGGRVRVNIGDPYDPDHPIVESHPDNFGTTPPRVNGERVVEDASAAPGVKRRTRKASGG